MKSNARKRHNSCLNSPSAGSCVYCTVISQYRDFWLREGKPLLIVKQAPVFLKLSSYHPLEQINFSSPSEEMILYISPALYKWASYIRYCHSICGDDISPVSVSTITPPSSAERLSREDSQKIFLLNAPCLLLLHWWFAALNIALESRQNWNNLDK